MSDKTPMTLMQRLTFTLNYIKNFMFIITPLTAGLIYVGTLVIEDTDAYKRVHAVVEWYEAKSMSFAVGLRVNSEISDKTGEIVHRIVYKAPDGELYKAVYSREGDHYYYLDDNGDLQECH